MFIFGHAYFLFHLGLTNEGVQKPPRKNLDTPLCVVPRAAGVSDSRASCCFKSD